ncbi:LuxR C-terminal-related transcriptional regulator [Actinomadura rayongensis]|uniref:DNA-binding response regulator n=1 Tax=Actinomadura rayongensis TaxID=1429076 RepID=A0A6I4WCG2_9ACTN|nr:response regulator transcription factor [Actinomadura rayongensis]MXQ67887.1 DNA-binding response regulator [Actinomadura rayongensis]
MQISGSPNDVLSVAVCGAPGVYRAGLMTVLRAIPGLDVVAEFDCAGYSPRVLREHRPRVLLMDLDGFDVGDLLARQIVGSTSELAVQVIALSSDRDSGAAIEVLRGGAQGFLHKDTPVQSLVEAIRAVDRGGVALDPHVARDLVTTLRYGVRAAPEPVAPDVGRVKLTPRQRQILGLVGLGLTNIEIADRLRLSRPTVKTHISSLLRVLELRDRTQLAVFACTHGFRELDARREKSA